MAKYAYYDSAAEAPQPVLGWYDTDRHAYANLPASPDLLPVSNADWQARLDGKPRWVSEGKLTATPPPLSLSMVKQRKIGELASGYRTAVNAGISFKTAAGVEKQFQADAASRQTLQDMLAAFTPGGSVPAGFYWKSSDNTAVPFTLADLQALAKALGERGWSDFQKLQDLKALVSNAAAPDAVDALSW